LIEVGANKQNSTPQEAWDRSAINPNDAKRAVKEFLDVLGENAFTISILWISKSNF